MSSSAVPDDPSLMLYVAAQHAHHYHVSNYLGLGDTTSVGQRLFLHLGV
jgi:hypothetical protein